MAWIESHDELPTHPKTLKAARRLKVCVPQVIGHLHVLWYWCLTHRPDGRLEGMDADDIADAAGWGDEGGPFITALLVAGWLDDDEGTLVVHDWWEGAGKTIKRRKFATTRQRRARESQLTDGQVTDESRDSHGDVTRDTSVSHGADSDRDRDKKLTPVGNGEPFVKRLAEELRSEHGCTLDNRGTLGVAYQELLDQALEHLPPDRHHGTAMGVIAGFVERVQGFEITREARSHTARLVRTHPPSQVFGGFAEALHWGAGVDAKYADDPLSLSKYVAGVLSKKRGAA